MKRSRSMRIAGARVTRSALESERSHLFIRNDRFSNSVEEDLLIDLSGCLLLPGLINAHDHLELNLFPRLGRGPYPNAAEWARDIYHPDRSPIREQLLISKAVRLFWGGIKNLLSGVTTVAHHNPYDPQVFDAHFPVRVIRNYGWAHSLQFSPDVVERFRNTPEHWPFIIHAAEGTDSGAFLEIERLDSLGTIDKRTVLVHAVAVCSSDIDRLKSRGCSVVWCPSSNDFTCGRTIGSDLLNSGLPIALGTDSALSASGDMVDEVEAARLFPQMTDDRIFWMLTREAARMFRLKPGFGEIHVGGPADLVGVADHGQTPAEAIARHTPEIVIINGRVKLISQELLDRNPHIAPGRMQRIALQGRGSWWIHANIARLRAFSERLLGAGFLLAGKQVTF